MNVVKDTIYDANWIGAGVPRDKANSSLSSVPLVMLASFDSPDDIKAGLDLGARDYIIKTETAPWDLARGVPGWAGLHGRLRAGALRALAGGAPNATLVSIPETSHLPGLERPLIFNELLRTFLVGLA